MRKKPIIAIDGLTATGKSTISRELAKKLNFKHINTGAIYRSVASKMIDQKIKETSEKKMIETAKLLDIDFSIKNGKSVVFLDGVDCTDKLYSQEVLFLTTKIVSNEKLREALIPVQRSFGVDGGIVVEGRDISSVIFPDAEWKFFIAASFEIRLKRLMKVYASRWKNFKKQDFANKLKERDFDDTSRPVAPLILTKDAIYYDNSNSPSELQDAIILEYYINSYSEIVENSRRLQTMIANKCITPLSLINPFQQKQKTPVAMSNVAQK